MSRLCRHVFDDRDPDNPQYSMTEWDLAIRCGGKNQALTVRKNHGTGGYEIWDYRNDEVVVKGSLEKVVEVVNDLEGRRSVEHGCSEKCLVSEQEA